MAIFRTLLNFLLKIRVLLQHYGAKLFNKVRDPETGKVVGMTPKQLKRILSWAGIIFFVGILITQLFKDDDFISDGGEAYKKELTPKSQVGMREQDYKSVFGDDPLNALKDGLDPLANLKGGKNGRKLQNGSGGYDDGSKKEGDLPGEAECLDLMDKMKGDIPLNDEEKKIFELCLDNNIGGFTAEEIALARKLLNDNLSAEERALLRKLLNGELDEGTDEYDIAKNLLKGGEAAEAARAALAALAARNQELYDALMKKMRGMELSPEELALLQAFRDAMGKAGDGLNGSDGTGGGTLTEKLQSLTTDVANRENEINDLESLINEAQIAAAKAGEKLAKGLKLTAAEQAAIQRLAELQKRLQALKDLQELRKQLLAKLMQELRNSLARANATLQEIYPSGTSVELLGKDECKDPSPFVMKKKKRGKSKFARKTKSEIWLDPNGRKLSPDEIRFIKLARLQDQAQKKATDDLINPGNSVLDGGERLNAAAVIGEGGSAGVEVDTLFVYKNQSQKDFQLTPDMRIPAVLDSQILISDKGRSQIVRVRILDDVYDPQSNRLVIPKNSVATGTTQGFDPDIGMMDLSFDKVVVGGKILDVKLQVGSANGSMGLKGEVRDTRGKYLLGAFITSFSAGALNWFSQAIVQDFLDDQTNAGNALTGAALQGGSEVMNQIAELYAGDLQNAAKIFWVPRNVPIVLFPNDN